jgi:hypothetical protein
MKYDCKTRGHIGKVLKVDYWLEDGDILEKVSSWGCTECEEISPTVWEGYGQYTLKVKDCTEDCNCFGCKVKTLQMNAGDATRDIPDKKWNAELQAYRDARSQGMQPAGTSMRHIKEAHDASETLNKAYNSETMPKAKDINKKSAAVLKEIGQI